jgi:hypothetical protein
MKTALITIITSLSVLAAIAGAGPTANTPNPTPNATQQPATGANMKDAKTIDKSKVVPSLLVQSATGYTYRDGKLTLHGINPLTISFADRPARLAGSVPTESVVADWAEGRDSFEKVPPNADFSTFSGDTVANAVLELRNPVLKGTDLTYDVRVLKGQLAEQGRESSLFIDIIGMPLTPMSYAGVARRSARRAAYWGAPVYGPGAYVGPHVAIY